MKIKLSDVKRENDVFFSSNNKKFFGDTQYKIDGRVLTVSGKVEGSNRLMFDHITEYFINDELKLYYIFKQKETGRRYYFCQPLSSDVVMKQFITEDGKADGQPV
jgi:hypothetical protein